MLNNIKIEICVGNIDDAIKAFNYPIDRAELNSAIELGGLTPSINELKILKENNVPYICSMVRCRGGNFVYSNLEYSQMFKDAKDLLENGSDGIVFGFLNEDRTINIDMTMDMISLIKSYGKDAIFHRAFDELDDQELGIQILIDLGIDRILTGGSYKDKDIIEGSKRIGKLQEKYGSQIELLPGGGVRKENIKEVLNNVGSRQIHMTSKKTLGSGNLGLDETQLVSMLKEIESL